jgi:hypothetical protein
MAKLYPKASLLKRWLIQVEHIDLYPVILTKLLDSYYDHIIVIDGGDITYFFKWVYNNMYLHHVRYQEKDYYERSNVWSKKMELLERPIHDPDNHCDSTSKHECDAPPELVPEDDAEVKYIIQKYDKSTFRSQVIDLSIKGIKLSELDPRRVLLFSSIPKIIFKNASGPNTNHQGSTHCQLHLAYEGVIAMNMPITLYKFATICYRLKSHKFNNSSESYDKCVTFKDTDLRIVNLYFQ